MKRSKIIITAVLGMLSLLTVGALKAQVRTDTIRVKGDIDKYYPVSFFDGGWLSNVATDLELGRSSTNNDGSNSGSMIAKFRFHVRNAGHGAGFIDGDVKQANLAVPTKGLFVAGWKDVSSDNNAATIVIWLRGNTTYFYKSSFPVAPQVYDGTVLPITYKPGGITYTVKTAVDPDINTYGYTSSSTAYYAGQGNNYFLGNIAVGTTDPGEFKLAVSGAIRGKRVKVEQNNWADFVFEPEYKLPSLCELENYIKANKHLPDVPSAKEVTKEGIDLGEMNKILLQKIEELTLHLIEQEKRIRELERQSDQSMNKTK
ncbi:hypothetical protein SAMN05428949_0782 [Chitinophaga sp. YR627]|uniref:hypothetical protein n=1 Tax=Chitinophaga sp. YR627 TaxID=1881041 RepID=UPI0008EBB94F|nr:hypothetical protein [Chitinophaga sp. YR627]SFM78549.1 hypothetical protein SAMN05428949_0782 [Chitinophaga sp. YR627]